MTGIVTQAIRSLAAIDAELGLPEDGCNSTARTLAAIRALQAKAEIAQALAKTTMAADCARDYPRQAPYRAVLMCDVAAERERCAAICDARSADHWRAYSDKSSPHFCDARFEAFSDESEECAKLIRGDNVQIDLETTR